VRKLRRELLEMSILREPIPTITGPGGFLIALIFIALILTSFESRGLAFDWQFALALVAISVPLSILITQTYQALFMKFGSRRMLEHFGSRWPRYKKRGHELVVMLDYLSWKRDLADKEWGIIRREATAFHLFNMLKWTSSLFLLGYVILLPWYALCQRMSVLWWGVAMTLAAAALCFYSFWAASKESWKTWMMIDRKLIKELKPCWTSWLIEEGIMKEDPPAIEEGRNQA